MHKDTLLEWNVLNTLTNPDYSDSVFNIMPALFTDERRELFEAMGEVYAKYGKITEEGLTITFGDTVPHELFAASEVDDMFSAVDNLARVAKKRQLEEQSALLRGLSNEFNPKDTDIEKALMFEAITTNDDATLRRAAIRTLGELHKKVNGEYLFTPTGLKFLDNALGGEWKPKAEIIVAGGAGTGKTALACNSMLNMADNHGIASMIFELEMNQEDLLLRHLAHTLSLDYTKQLQTGNLTAEDLRAVEKQTEYLQTLPMYVFDDGGMPLYKVITLIRKYVRKYNVRVVFIDHVQILNYSPTGNRNHDLGDASKRLKDLAKALDITVVLLSQVNRSGEGLDALRDSGEMQANVDAVFKLIPDNDGNNVYGIAVECLKNRYGPTRKSNVLFNGAFQRFEDGM